MMYTANPIDHTLAYVLERTGCIRVLVLWNTEKGQDEIRHVYLRDAVKLRPDLMSATIANNSQHEN